MAVTPVTVILDIYCLVFITVLVCNTKNVVATDCLILDANECDSNHGGCNHTCNNTDGSFVCSCDSGYTLDSDKLGCLGISETNITYMYNGFSSDIDECADGNGGCEQNCNNTMGSYICLCDEGYELNDDNHTCKGRQTTSSQW